MDLSYCLPAACEGNIVSGCVRMCKVLRYLRAFTSLQSHLHWSSAAVAPRPTDSAVCVHYHYLTITLCFARRSPNTPVTAGL